MEQANFAAIAGLQANNWWYGARRDLLERALRGLPAAENALDVGCGAGANLEVLGRHCRRATGIDLSGWAVEWCRRGRSAALVQADLERLPFTDRAFDLVTCMDVLEHVDDAVAVAEVRRVLRPGGSMVVNVPAHRFLWNDNDDFSHHRRRYSRKRLSALFADWEVVDLGYWCFSPFLPALAYSLWCRARPPRVERNNLDRVPGCVGPILKRTLITENRLRRVLSLPTGTSLFAVVRSPRGAPPAAGGGRE